jgi:hypothetical protein
VNKELLRKIGLEFDHIELYGEVSQHFDEIRAELSVAGLSRQGSNRLNFRGPGGRAF